jgi:hypothetical protein
MVRHFLESAQGTRTTARGCAGIAVVRTRNGMKGRDIEGMSNGRWTRGFRGKDSGGMGFMAEGGGDGEFLIVEFYKRSG